MEGTILHETIYTSVRMKKHKCVLFKTDFEEGIWQDEMGLFAKEAPNERSFTQMVWLN